MSDLLTNPWVITIVSGVVVIIIPALVTYFIQRVRKKIAPSVLALHIKALQLTGKELALTYEEKRIIKSSFQDSEVRRIIKTEAFSPEDEFRQLGAVITKLASHTGLAFKQQPVPNVVKVLLRKEYELEGEYDTYRSRVSERRHYFAPSFISEEKRVVVGNLSTASAPIHRTFFSRFESLQGFAEHCIGREKDLEKLSVALADPAIRLIIIEGFGGIGKTTIAAQFALFARHAYNICWVECKDVNVTTERLLLEISHVALEQYNITWLQTTVENPVISEPEKISSFIEFLSLTAPSADKAPQPLALFLDDYHLATNPSLDRFIRKVTESHVRIKVVIITRQLPKELQTRATSDNTVLLNGLVFADCRTYITSYATKFPALKGVSEETLHAIWTRTGHGVPTALNLLVSMTRTRPLQDILQQLPDYDTHTIADGWFSSLFSELSLQEQEAAKKVSILRRPILRSILRRMDRDIYIDRIIDELVDRFVLMFDGSQYFMHALWSEYTQKILPVHDKTELHRNAAIVYRDFASTERVTRVMNKVESCYHFVQTADLDEAVEVILPVANTLRFWGAYQELLDILNEVEGLARSLGKSLDPRLRIQQCAALHASGQAEYAIAALNELIQTSTGEIEITALQELGWICVETGDNQKAEELLLQSLHLTRQQGLYKLEGEALFKLQYNAYHTSKLDDCLKYNLERLQIFQGIKNDPEAQEIAIWIYHDIGSVYRERGYYEEALNYYQRSLKFWSTVESSPYRAALLYYDVGQIYRDQGKYQKALQMFKTAYQLYKQINFPYGMAHAQTEIGRVGSRFDQTAEPIEQVKEAICILHQVKAPTGEAYALNALGEVYLSRNQPEQALSCLQQSLKINTPINNTKDMARAFHRMGLAYEQLGDRLQLEKKQEEACSHWEKALERIRQAKEVFSDPVLVTNFESIDDNIHRIQKKQLECDEGKHIR